MGFKTTSTRFTQAKSAQSSDLVAYNNATSGGPSISGTSLSTASAITTVTATPGQSAASGTTSSGVLISTVVYTDSGYNTLTANAASTTFGYVRILGSGFIANANVFISNTGGTLTNVTTNTTFVGSGEIRANVPSTTAGNYTLYVFNPSGSAAIYYSGIAFEPYPLWNTTSVTFGGTTISGNVATYVTSTAGIQPITFSLAAGNTLPSGLTLYSNGAILGTITQSNSTQTYYANIVATDLYNEATTSNISLTVNLTDPSFNSTTLLLNGETNTGTNYIADASTNNFALTVSGAANPNRFSPLWGAGYYGNYFDGSTGYFASLSSAQFTFGTNNFTVEGWFYLTGLNATADGIFQQGTSSFPASTTNTVAFATVGTTNFQIYANNVQNNFSPAVVPVLNQWYHFAIVRNSGTTTAYLNGVSKLSISDATNYTGTYFGIGNIYGSNAYYMNGYISNFRVVNGTAVYTANFTPPTTPLTAIANTALLTCQSANFVDNSTNAFTLSPSGTVKVVPNQPFGALPSGVQNYGSSLFDGSTGYLSSGARSAFAFGTGDFTIEFWMYVNSSAGNYETMYSLAHSAGSVIVRFGNSGSYNSLLQVSMTGSTASVVYSTGIPQTTALNNWVHVAFTRASSTCRVFYNGIQQVLNTGTNPTTFPLSSFTDTTNVNTVTSSYIGGDGGTTYFPGYISNARVVNGTAVYTANFTPPTTPLTAIANTSLLTLQNKNGANNNVFYDDSVNNFPITRTGTPTQGTFTPFSQTGWSNYFDGSTGYFSMGTASNWSFLNNGTTNYTIECWVYPTSTSNEIILGTDSTVYGAGMYVGINSANAGDVALGINNSNPGGLSWETNTGGWVPQNTWTHIAVCIAVNTLATQSIVTIYTNGVSRPLTLSTIGSSPDGWTSSTSNSLLVGACQGVSGHAPSASYLYGGYISNLRITKSIVYASAFTPPTTPLTAIANTALLTCQSNRFLDNSTNAFTLTPSGTVQVQAFSPFAPGVSYSSANNGGSMYFNGSSDALTLASNPAWGLGYLNSTSCTLEGWVYYLSAPASATLFSIYDYYSGTQFGWAFGTNSSSILTFAGFGNGGSYSGNHNAFSATGTTTLRTGQWYHVAFVKNGTTGTIYLNGAVEATSTFSEAVNDALHLGIGVSFTGNGSLSGYTPSCYMSGIRFTKNVALYTSAFTLPTSPPTLNPNVSLMLLGTNTGVQDATGKNDIITVGSAKTQSNTVKYGTGAMYFDGAGSSMYVPSNVKFGFGTGNFTIEFWLYLNATTTQTIFSEISTGSTQVVPHIYYSNASGIRYFVNGVDVITGGALSTGTWYHIAVCRSSGSTKMFINGTQTGPTYTDSNNYLASTPIILGDYDIPPTGASTLNGYLDDLRITNGIARYTSNFTPPTTAFLTL